MNFLKHIELVQYTTGKSNMLVLIYKRKTSICSQKEKSLKAYLRVTAFLLHVASWPAKRIVTKIIFVALPPFILDDPLIASGFEKQMKQRLL